jgi:hypothetical protein
MPKSIYKSLFTTVTLCFLLIGCGSSDHNQSALAGRWVTTSCEQPSDISGTSAEVWIKSIYEFTSEGAVLNGYYRYSDSNCENLSSSTPPAAFPKYLVTYVDKSPQTLQEGIEGNALMLKVDMVDDSFSVDAFYTINAGVLCFSDAFDFGALSFGFSDMGTDAIDFTHCLRREE